MKHKDKLLIALLVICVEFFLVGSVQIFFPNANIVLKLNEDSNLEKGWICGKHDIQEITFKENYSGIWEGFLSNNNYNLEEHIEIDLSCGAARSIENNYPTKVVNVEKITPHYSNIQVLIIYNNLFKQISAFAICNIILFYTFFRLKKSQKSLTDILGNFLYNLSGLKIIGKKMIFFSIVVSFLSIIVKPGTDYLATSQAIAMNISGIDVYQVQNIYELYLNDATFVTWPYNPILINFYSLSGILALGYSPFYIHTAFGILPALLLKAVNIILMNAITLSILGFLLDYNMIFAKNVRKIYLWSMLNPLVFYIAILYIQLDIFPIYCVCTGSLLFCKKDFKPETGITGAVLLAFGMSCKMQNILMIPTIALLLFMIAIKNRKKIYYIMLSLVLLAIHYINIYVSNSIIGSFIGANKQGERIWYTVFGMAPELFIYITIFVIVLFFMSNMFLHNSKIKTEYLLCNSMFMLGGVVLVFSASIISTPSTLMISFPAFILCMAIEDNWVKRTVIALFSFLCVIDVMFSSIGDITNMLNYVGKEGIFTALESRLLGTAEGTKWVSLINTIAKAAMTAYAILFYKYGSKMLTKENSLSKE